MRDNILKCAANDDERVFVAKLIDKFEQARQHGKVKSTYFLSPREQALFGVVAQHFKGLCYKLDGGYAEAERKIGLIASFSCDEMDVAAKFILAGFYKDASLSHRDFLGALMSLGIKRETVGDIVVDQSSAIIVCANEISSFIIETLTAVGSFGVKLSYCTSESILHQPKKQSISYQTAASLRLDGVLSAALSISRAKSALLIKAELVTVNWVVEPSTKKEVKFGDVLSIKGYGRFELCEVVGTTKKGRVGFRVAKLL